MLTLLGCQLVLEENASSLYSEALQIISKIHVAVVVALLETKVRRWSSLSPRAPAFFQDTETQITSWLEEHCRSHSMGNSPSPVRARISFAVFLSWSKVLLWISAKLFYPMPDTGSCWVNVEQLLHIVRGGMFCVRILWWSELCSMNGINTN